MQFLFTIAMMLCLVVTGAFAHAEESLREEQLTIYRSHLHQSPLSRQTRVPEGTVIRMTVDDCIHYALRSNRKIMSTDYAIAAAEAQERESHALGKPVVDYEYGTAPAPRDATRAIQTFFTGDWVWANRVKLGMGIPLTTFGKLTTASELAQSGIAASRERRASEQVQVVSKIRQLYYGIQMAEEVRSLLLNAIDRLSDEIKTAESQDTDIDGKTSEKYSPIDKLRMQVFRADLEKRLTDVQVKEEVALNALKIQMGLPMTANFAPTGALAPVSVKMDTYDAYISRLRADRPESHLVDLGVEAKRLEHQLSKRQLRPDVGFGAFLEAGRTLPSVQNQGTNDQFINPFNFTRAGVGFKLSGRLDINSAIARINRTESEFYKVSLERDMAKEGLELEVKEAYLRVKQSEEQLKRTEETKKLARQMVFLSKSNLDLGIGEKSEYVDALQVMLLSRSQYLESVFNYNSAVAQLDEKVGYVPYGLDDRERVPLQLPKKAPASVKESE
ncbi:MAG: hypothetical protein COV45_07700 [Deltaproteobacteria bacterium CG11_big_fil_rev_8_21_14_0_20_47_16]|nr:MAG: hypothetical protein COV45_07700 [Deltaproteobacteria bacterium CG11_big_fil_rev_8_21_14_0_20_47_16]